MNAKQINRIKRSVNPIQTAANIVARQHGRGYATEIKFSRTEKEPKIVRNRPYGLRSTSGKFYPYRTMSKYPYGGCYEGIECIVQLPVSFIDFALNC